MATDIVKSGTSEIEQTRQSEVRKEIGISIVKGALGAVPWVGQALNEALFDCRARIKQERLNQFFADVAKEVDVLGEEKLDKDYITTEEFSDFLEQLLIRVAANRSDRKRSILKGILTAGLQGSKPPDLSSMFLAILGEMSDPEMELFSKFYQRHVDRQPYLSSQASDYDDASYWKFTPDKIAELGITPNDFLVTVQSMIRKGILYDEGMGRWDCRPYQLVQISELGMRFYAYITAK